MKKLESLGKRLTKNEQKKITGGAELADPGGTGNCGLQCDTTCNVVCNGSVVLGKCGYGSTGKCFCSGAC